MAPTYGWRWIRIGLKLHCRHTQSWAARQMHSSTQSHMQNRWCAIIMNEFALHSDPISMYMLLHSAGSIPLIIELIIKIRARGFYFCLCKGVRVRRYCNAWGTPLEMWRVRNSNGVVGREWHHHSSSRTSGWVANRTGFVSDLNLVDVCVCALSGALQLI